MYTIVNSNKKKFNHSKLNGMTISECSNMRVPEAPQCVRCACISLLVLHLLPYLTTLTILGDVAFTWNHGPPRRQTGD